MKKMFTSRRWRWVLLTIAFGLAFLALVRLNKLVEQVRSEEQQKVEIWAEAISRKAELVEHTERFFQELQTEERRKVELFIEAHKAIMQQPLDADLDFHFRFISDNKTIPVIITDESNTIQLSQNVEIPNGTKVLSGDLYKRFTRHNPILYGGYGMRFKLFYTESNVYIDLRNALNSLTESFLKEISENTVSVPVLVMDSSLQLVFASGNVPEKQMEDPQTLRKTLQRMKSENDPISIMLPGEQPALIFYENSPVLTALRYYPLIYIVVVAIFAVIFYVLFSMARSEEQNLVWIGMSKETAHQLGTPISSLMAWIEYLKLTNRDDEMVQEIQKDVSRLETIAQRFSKIGSVPELQEEDLIAVINRSIDYLKTRTSKNITYDIRLPKDRPVNIAMNAYLMEWVLENTCKNAIDAMNGVGTFGIEVSEDNQHVIIDISDTGRGMAKGLYQKIFSPGFTTKKRGWGLGLSLTKRIIKNYHKGDIYVKKSEIGKGTTFRIELHKKQNRKQL